MRVSEASSKAADYLGSITDFLSSAYRFDRKQNQSSGFIISLVNTTPKIHRIINMSEARNTTR